MAGDQPLPLPILERELRRRLALPEVDVKVIRSEGRRSLVRIPHTAVAAARTAWNLPPPPGELELHTIASYGTMRKGKAWLRGRSPGAARTS